MLRPAPALHDRFRCRLEDYGQPHLQDLVFLTGEEMTTLEDLLRQVLVTVIEIHHYLDHDPAVLELPRRLGLPYRVFIHDYSWLCPQICLIDGSGRYCGEPALETCERCLSENGSQTGERLSVAALRQRSAAMLGRAQAVVVPSRDVAVRFVRHFSLSNVRVEPWEDVRGAVAGNRAPRRGGHWRVCVIGMIGDHKGYQVLRDCALDAAHRNLPLEFVVVGFSKDDSRLFATGRVFVTGPFKEEEAIEVIRRQGADIAFLPSVWPETWSYTLSSAWRAGLDVVAFDLGTIAERIQLFGSGFLLPQTLSPAATNDALLEACRGHPAV